MNNLNNRHPNILDLPDEILLIILKKLNIVDVLYSLADVNRRFLRLISDSEYISDLDLTHLVNIDSMNVSRICQQILPSIHHHVQNLTLEQNSVQKILLAGTYPQLYSLSFSNFQQEILHQYLTDDFNLRGLLTKQITHLNISIIKSTDETALVIRPEIFELILSLCKKLSVLKFDDMFPIETFSTPLTALPLNFTSSTLIKLKINVRFFTDCLCLLDGRLDSLSILIIKVLYYDHQVHRIDTRKKLSQLKYFSYTSFAEMYDYKGQMVPLLCRMTNLEELQLYLSVLEGRPGYIDGIQLHDQFLNHLTKLKKFAFNIKTRLFGQNIIDLPSNDDVQRSFIGNSYAPVISSVNNDIVGSRGECRIYSLPYDFEYFVGLDNIFPRGVFDKVRLLTVTDKTSFEQKFFRLISEECPSLEYLCIENFTPMKDKQYPTTLITFPHLIFLDIIWAHVDYVLLFLSKTNTHLPCLTKLQILDKTLKKITNSFTNDSKHFHFGQLKSLDIFDSYSNSFVRPTIFPEYLPLL